MSSVFFGALRVTVALMPAVGVLACAAGCANTIDRFAVDRVLARTVVQPDVDRGCAVGLSLGYPLEAATKPGKPPARGVVMSDASAAMCAEAVVRETQLESARLETNFVGLDPAAQIALIKDARAREVRAHQLAAQRYARAWSVAESFWGPIGGGSCPKLKEEDEIVWVLALNSGLQGLMHDRAAGGTLGLPLDLLLKVARGSECLDDARWWHLPEAMRAAAWATVPGSAPDGVDPWALLEQAASTGDDGGVRIARALQAVIAANNGRPDVLEGAIRDYAASLNAVPRNAEFALFDDFALLLVRHESDLLWTKAKGHRTLVLGELPGDDAMPPSVGTDPFGGDPFGGDPFGGDPFGGEGTPSGDASPEEEE